MDDLRKSQKRVLISMYKLFLSKQPALSEYETNDFGNADQVNADCGFGYTHDEISDICLALFDKGYINGDRGDDTIGDILLTDSTIVYMENKFNRNMNSILSVISKLKP